MQRKNMAIASLGLLLLLSGCASQTKKLRPPTSNKQILSITPTPRTWDGPGLTHSFAEAAKIASIAAIPDPVEWWHLEGRDPSTSKAATSAPWQNHLLKQHNMGVFIQVDPRSILPNRTYKEQDIRAAYMADVLQRHQLYKPSYMNLGVEINSLVDRSDYSDLVSLIRQAAKAIRQRDSKVTLCVSFQYEHLRDHNQWKYLSDFGFLDAIGISSYPRKANSSMFGDPKNLPSDYYWRVSKHTKKPIVFAELGWSVDARFGGSLQSQKEFLERFFDVLISDLDVLMVNWWFLYDNVGHGSFFDKMGLIDSETGKKRPSWTVYNRHGK
jgi:hypothetical protein